MITIDEIINSAAEMDASDIHISTGSELIFRVYGNAERVSDDKLTSDDVNEVINSISSETILDEFKKTGESDFARTVCGRRIRVNIFHKQGEPAIAMRLLPSEIPSTEKLKLPKIMTDICHNKKGLILITGPTGSGKSTTLASLINYINVNMSKHIITLEDPIEYVHEDKQSLVQHREVGADTLTFASGIRAAMREDPDVILIGEMRDTETMGIALTAAETGHLVFATLHANSATSTIDRIIDAFPTEAQQQIRTQLTNVLTASISQMLVPCTEGGRVGVYEIMLANDAVRVHIRNAQSQLLTSDIDIGREEGMCSMNDAFLTLLEQKKITKELFLEYVKDDSIIKKARDRLGIMK